MALCQCADCHESTNDGPRLLLSFRDCFAQGLVAIGHCFYRVVAVTSQHALLEGTYANFGLSCRSYIIGRDRPDTGPTRLPDVRVGLPSLARLDVDSLRTVLPNVASSDCVLHLLVDKIFVRRRRDGACLH